MEEQANVGRFTKLPLHVRPGFPCWVHLRYLVQDEEGRLWVDRSAPASMATPVLPRMSRLVRGYVNDDQFRVSNRQATDWSKVVRITGVVDETVWMKVMWS